MGLPHRVRVLNRIDPTRLPSRLGRAKGRGPWRTVIGRRAWVGFALGSALAPAAQAQQCLVGLPGSAAVRGGAVASAVSAHQWGLHASAWAPAGRFTIRPGAGFVSHRRAEDVDLRLSLALPYRFHEVGGGSPGSCAVLAGETTFLREAQEWIARAGFAGTSGAVAALAPVPVRVGAAGWIGFARTTFDRSSCPSCPEPLNEVFAALDLQVVLTLSHRLALAPNVQFVVGREQGETRLGLTLSIAMPK